MNKQSLTFRLISILAIFAAFIGWNVTRNHYPYGSISSYQPKISPLPPGFSSDNQSDSLLLGEIRDRLFWQYSEGDHIYYFTTDKKGNHLNQSHSIRSSHYETVLESGITFYENFEEDEVFAWFPGIYQGHQASNPFAVAYKEEISNTHNSNLFNFDILSPFKNFSYQVKSSSGNIVEFTLPSTNIEPIVH